MDRIAAIVDRELYDQVIPTAEICSDLLQPRASIIRATKRTTYSYGAHERHDLDLYVPAPGTVNPTGGGGNRPLLVFLYGGGFASGDKLFDLIPGDLVYANLGSLFADELGYEVAVVNYRLTKHGARFPRGAEDLDMALKWLDGHYGPHGPKDLYIIGNSAGGIHLTTWLFRSEYEDTRELLVTGGDSLRIRAAITLGTPFIWPQLVLDSKVGESVKGYYGSEQQVKENASLFLAEQALQTAPEAAAWPPILTLVSEWDPEDIRTSGRDFMELWRSAGQKGDYHVLDGHNHFSTVWALRSGDKRLEKWTHDLQHWLKTLVS